MTHSRFRATLALATPLGTPLAGDMLFGHFCWALRERSGNPALQQVLDGYTDGRPWIVASDGFPSGYLPRPTLPQHFDQQTDPAARKAAKRRHWIPEQAAGAASLRRLLASAVDDAAAYGAEPLPSMQAHNTLNRLTGTTGEGAFAPYSMRQVFHVAGQQVDVYLVLDEERLPADLAARLLEDIGAAGFGRDASIGLGKFTLVGFAPVSLPTPPSANAWWTLAPSSPQGGGFDGARSYWRAQTRFGRHGNAHALAANPFKAPVLLAATGAVFVPQQSAGPRTFVGRGLGGRGNLSKAEPGTVHQGYAPVVPISMELAPA